MKRLIVAALLVLSGPEAVCAADSPPPPALTDARAKVQCVARMGWYWECQAQDETPAGQGVGAAAVSMAACMPASEESGDQARTVSVPIKFQKVGLPMDPTRVCPANPALPAVADREVRQPVWLAQPSARQYADAYPFKDSNRKISGSVLIQCLVENGAYTHCTVLREAPLGRGFGPAAFEVFKAYKIAPMDKTGEPVEGRPLRINVMWAVTRGSGGGGGGRGGGGRGGGRGGF